MSRSTYRVVVVFGVERESMQERGGGALDVSTFSFKMIDRYTEQYYGTFVLSCSQFKPTHICILDYQYLYPILPMLFRFFFMSGRLFL